MTWVAWRQFRTQALVTLGLLVAVAVPVLVTGLHMRDVYTSLGGAGCGAHHDCAALIAHDRTVASLLGYGLLGIPGLLGIFWGAPLVAREFETGTYRLAWTQSVTRRRWLLVRVALVGVAALVTAGLASWLVSWWFAPLDAVNMNRLDPSVFTARGVVAIGYAGFAFALGVTAGALTRRTLPAMVVTLFGFVTARIAVTLWVRPHLLAGKHVVVALGQNLGFLKTPSGVKVFVSTPNIPNAWATSSALLDHAHHAVSSLQLHDLLARACPALAAGLSQGSPQRAFTSCLQALSPHLLEVVTYQPSSHYWPLQALETGIFLAAALALIGATAWRLGRRAAPKPAIGEERERSARELGLTPARPPA